MTWTQCPMLWSRQICCLMRCNLHRFIPQAIQFLGRQEKDLLEHLACVVPNANARQQHSFSWKQVMFKLPQSYPNCTILQGCPGRWKFTQCSNIINLHFRSSMDWVSDSVVDWSVPESKTCPVLGRINLTSHAPVTDDLFVSVIPQSCSPDFKPQHVRISSLLFQVRPFLMTCTWHQLDVG